MKPQPFLERTEELTDGSLSEKQPYLLSGSACSRLDKGGTAHSKLVASSLHFSHAGDVSDTVYY